MSSASLIRLGGLAAVLAGVLRTIASFIPYSKPDVALELFYLVIDILILLGLLGVYGYQHEKVGVVGFLGFLSALIGTAIIVGPDGAIGGVDEYVIGSLMISVGLTLLAIGSWQARALPRPVPALWVLSTVVGVGGFVAGGFPITYLIAGVAFGLAFILAGVRIWTTQGSVKGAG
jgi:hypothetical protein